MAGRSRKTEKNQTKAMRKKLTGNGETGIVYINSLTETEEKT